MAQLKDLLVNGQSRFLSDVTLGHDPTANLQATTKQYTDKMDVEFIQGTQTGSTDTLTGVTKRAALFDGMQINYWLPYATVGTNVTLNLTLADGTTTGAVNVYYQKTTRLTTHYGAGNIIPLVYRSNVDIGGTSYTGWWGPANYDTNTTNVSISRYYYSCPKVDSNSDFTLYRGQLVLPTKTGTYVPYSNGNDQRTTYTKTMTTDAFDPFGTILWFYYTGNSTYAAGTAMPAGYLQNMYDLIDTRYSFNIYSSGTAGTTALTANQPVYIKAKFNRNTHTATLVPDASSSNYLDRSSIVQALPSSNPNSGLQTYETYIYILLGYAYDKYRLNLHTTHPIYYWDSGSSAIAHFIDLPLYNGGIS